ncbi:MAG: hypothetical protein GY845_20595, partial [Planctomycetes bacterium]|nr:hypothetical protein [Planctomycetota bacterium]
MTSKQIVGRDILKTMAIGGAIVLVLTGLLLGGCNSESDCNDLETQNAALEKDGIDLRTELENLGDEYDSIISEHEVMCQELDALQADYKDLLQLKGESSLKNPTWQELKRFLELDNTNENEYIADEFD